MLEIVLVRHGDICDSYKGTYLGWTDVPLSDRGTEEAEALGLKLAEADAAAVYSSPLKRASQTAEIINSFLMSRITYIDGLKERSFGIWEGMDRGSIMEKYPEACKKWDEDWTGYAMDGGESAGRVYERNAGTMNNILGRHHKGSIILVTHLGVIRNMLAFLLGLGVEGAWRFRVDTGSISTLKRNDSGYIYMDCLNLK